MRKTAILALSLLILFGCSGEGEGDIIELSGTAETIGVTLSSEVAGKIKAVYKDDGARVFAEDTILIVNPEIYEIQLQQAKAQLSSAKARYEILRKGARSEDIEQAEAALKQAEANYNSAKADFERFKNLYESHSITKKQFEDAETRLSVAEAQYSAAKENLHKVKNIARPEELEQAKAGYEAAEASVRLAQKRVNDCYILSPIDGKIVRVFAEIGETANPQSALAKISDLSKIEVTVYIQEPDLGKVKLGQKAEIYSDSYQDKSYEGKVTYISPEAEFTPKNIQTKEERTKLVYAVKLSVPNPDFELKSGMPVDAKIMLR